MFSDLILILRQAKEPQNTPRPCKIVEIIGYFLGFRVISITVAVLAGLELIRIEVALPNFALRPIEIKRHAL